MKCPDCSSRVDHSCLVNGPKGEEYYICPNCGLNLVHRTSFGKDLLWVAIGLPVIWFVTDFLVAVLIGPVVGDAMIMSVQAVDAIAAAVSIIIVILVINHTMRLVRR